MDEQDWERLANKHGHGIDVDKATIEDLNEYITTKLHIHVRDNFTDYDLWILFREEFENFTADTFRILRADHRAKLRKHLLYRGVYVAKPTSRTSLSDILYNLVQEDELHEWTDEELADVFIGAREPLNTKLRHRLNPTCTGLALHGRLLHPQPNYQVDPQPQAPPLRQVLLPRQAPLLPARQSAPQATPVAINPLPTTPVTPQVTAPATLQVTAPATPQPAVSQALPQPQASLQPQYVQPRPQPPNPLGTLEDWMRIGLPVPPSLRPPNTDVYGRPLQQPQYSQPQPQYRVSPQPQYSIQPPFVQPQVQPQSQYQASYVQPQASQRSVQYDDDDNWSWPSNKQEQLETSESYEQPDFYYEVNDDEDEDDGQSEGEDSDDDDYNDDYSDDDYE